MSVTVIGPRWSLGLHQDSCPRISDLRGNGEGWWVNKAGSIFVIFGSLLTTRAQEQLKKTVVCVHSSFAKTGFCFYLGFTQHPIKDFWNIVPSHEVRQRGHKAKLLSWQTICIQSHIELPWGFECGTWGWRSISSHVMLTCCTLDMAH